MAFYPKPQARAADSDTAPQEDSPFNAAADLDIDDDDELLAANTEQPMVFDDGTHLANADLAQVDVAERDFVQKAHTLAAEADLEAFKFEIDRCTEKENYPNHGHCMLQSIILSDVHLTDCIIQPLMILNLVLLSCTPILQQGMQ